jgi:hypothetical protein
MSTVRIVIKKKARKLYVYRGGKVVFKTAVAHGERGTRPGVRKIAKWVWGAVSHRTDYKPTTWFSFGATFHSKYRWPAPGDKGYVNPGHGKFEAERISADLAKVKYRGTWWPVWKDSNPFGVLMAELEPGRIELHGTSRDQAGADELPSMSGSDVTHGCIRVTNSAIRRIKSLAPVGTEVSVER